MAHGGNKIGLALSGGGYRAAAYHIGALRALYKLRILDKVDVISSVSGGSIIAAYYGLHDGSYESFDKDFSEKIQTGVLHLAIANLVLVIALMVWAFCFWGLWGLLSFVVLFLTWYWLLPVSKLISWQYDWLFFRRKKLKDLRTSPVITINATDYPTVSQFTFSGERIYAYYYGKDAFYHEQFPISKAVMASSCVPFAFCPIRISKKYWTNQMRRIIPPLLLDGGLYDNQGTHLLTDKSSPYACTYIIVSDAGNGVVPNKFYLNPLITLKRTSEVFMQRIKKVQRQQNLYMKSFPDKRFAYAPLEWEVNEKMLDGFVDNLMHDNVSPEVISAHQIPPIDIVQLKNSYTAEAARARIVALLKENVKWEELCAIRPMKEEHDKAYSTSTGLFGLSEERIYQLSKEAEWKITLQVRLYLPNLL